MSLFLMLLLSLPSFPTTIVRPGGGGGGLFGASNLRCSYDQQYGLFINLITHSYYLLCRNHVQPSKKSHTSILTHNPKTM